MLLRHSLKMTKNGKKIDTGKLLRDYGYTFIESLNVETTAKQLLYDKGVI